MSAENFLRRLGASTSHRRTLQLTAIVAVAILFAFFKLGGTSIDQTLWAEDGPIFIDQARELGTSSLWTPYAGYFHAFPRIVAWLSSFFDLKLTPLIFFSAWMLIYAALISVAASRAIQYGVNPAVAGLLTLLMVAQPHSGEVFFNLTNSQWIMGGTLALYLLNPTPDRPSIYKKVAILIASLTGPFSVVLTPLLLIQSTIFKDWHQRKQITIIVVFGAIVQTIAILSSSRLGNGGIDTVLQHWATPLITFLTFGGGKIVKTFATIFWLSLAFAFYIHVTSGSDPKRANGRANLASIFVLIGAAMFFGASLEAIKADPQWLSSLDAAGRYFFIPYLLVFFAAGLLSSGKPRLTIVLFALMASIDIASYRPFIRGDLQFEAFSEFARRKENVLIPIHPQWEALPPWNVIARVPHSGGFNHSSNSVSLNIRHARLDNITLQNSSEQPEALVVSDAGSHLTYSLNGSCPNSKMFGVEFDVERESAGWAQIHWGPTDNFSEARTFRRYYPTGRTLIQFAFTADSVSFLRFAPSNRKGSVQVHSARLYCL